MRYEVVYRGRSGHARTVSFLASTNREAIKLFWDWVGTFKRYIHIICVTEEK